MLIAAYLIEAGFVLIVTPWTSFWLRNYFAQTWPWLGDAMALTLVRGAVTSVGVVTAIAGVVDLISALIARRAAAGAPSSITPADGPRP